MDAIIFDPKLDLGKAGGKRELVVMCVILYSVIEWGGRAGHLSH
jgi:hypothetical protein